MTTYGQKGGEGPTRGKTATAYLVTLPNGTTARKRVFAELVDPVGYAYKHGGAWYVATVAERDDPQFAHYTQCLAVPVLTAGDRVLLENQPDPARDGVYIVGRAVRS